MFLTGIRALTDHVKTRDVGKLFQALISRLEDGTQLDRVSAEVATLLTDTMPSDANAVSIPSPCLPSSGLDYCTFLYKGAFGKEDVPSLCNDCQAGLVSGLTPYRLVALCSC